MSFVGELELPCSVMHRPRSQRSARAMRLGAGMLLFAVPVALLTVLVLGIAVYFREPQIAMVGLGLAGFTAVLLIAYRIFSASAHCPLCRAPVIGGSGAQRNRHSRRLFGSYRLRVASGIIVRNRFVCPYCNEATCCTPKERPPGGEGNGSGMNSRTV